MGREFTEEDDRRLCEQAHKVIYYEGMTSAEANDYADRVQSEVCKNYIRRDDLLRSEQKMAFERRKGQWQIW